MKITLFNTNENRIRTVGVVLCVFAAIIASIVLATEPDMVFASDAEVYFGSEEYSSETGGSFKVGVYIDADKTIGKYRVEISYDHLRLDCTDGADAVDDDAGLIVLEGEDDGRRVRRMLSFETKSGGDAAIAVVNAEVHSQSDESETFDVVQMASVGVTIDGEDTAASLEQEIANRQRLEQEAKQREEDVKSTSEYLRKHNKNRKKSIIFNSYIFVIVVLVLCLIIIEVIVLFILRVVRIRRRKKERMKRRAMMEKGHTVHNMDGKPRDPKMRPAIVDEKKEKELAKKLGEPVVAVKDVTMVFKLYSNQPSGIKDYIIALLKRNITYRRLFALYHVSFNVYKGEVVGIIGTNGSGKSTILKIVSGAMKPTSGTVDVDRSKVQLLTLGTGFDMELTGRENVYLNGAIIGYSKEFLDEHYNEIVEFAELSDFMDEKVKNYSSGMVSRLGFAIATAGDAAEILILDEVLSVGDEFFRKKSLARIKEMIHGGSTVLMVSHGMGTILDNCTKCVWIEKGRLMMVGEPKVVCAEYRKMEQ